MNFKLRMAIMMSDLNEFVKVSIEEIPFHDAPVMYVGVLGILAWIAVLLRLYTRTRILRSLGWDDYTMVMALVSKTLRTIEKADMRQLAVLYHLRNLLCVAPCDDHWKDCS
jgi:hypothetical protein